MLCHADIHTNNVLLDAGGAVWIVDWDDTVLAPKERDLMFVVGGGINRTLVGPPEEALFLQGYGATTMDPLALTYYRYAWAVSDIGEYAARVVLRPDLGVVSRRAAVGQFLSLFQPGRIVALALASEEGAGGRPLSAVVPAPGAPRHEPRRASVPCSGVLPGSPRVYAMKYELPLDPSGTCPL